MVDGSLGMAGPGGQPDHSGNGKATKGEQAYRWIVAGGMALIVALSARVLNSVDQMATKIELLQDKVTAINATMTWAERRNDTQDTKIEDLQRRVWRIPETRSP